MAIIDWLSGAPGRSAMYHAPQPLWRYVIELREHGRAVGLGYGRTERAAVANALTDWGREGGLRLNRLAGR